MASHDAVPSRERIFEALYQQILVLRTRDPVLPRVAIGLSSSIMTDLGFDSISLLELLVGVELALVVRHGSSGLVDRQSRGGWIVSMERRATENDVRIEGRRGSPQCRAARGGR